MITLKRVYEPAEKEDGARYLVERLWPRGISKEKLALTGWLKELAPSDALRRWFNHDPLKWEEFQLRYRQELAQADPNLIESILLEARQGPVTLLYSAHDTEHNNALVLKTFLEERL